MLCYISYINLTFKWFEKENKCCIKWRDLMLRQSQGFQETDISSELSCVPLQFDIFHFVIKTLCFAQITITGMGGYNFSQDEGI